MRNRHQSGIALVTTVLMLLLMSALLVGFTMLVMSDQRLGGFERDRTQALYAAHAGLEKMTSDLGTLFSANSAPTGAMVNALQGPAAAPVLPGITYQDPGGGLGTGYTIQFPVDGFGNPSATNRTVLSGPFQGMIGLITPYTMTVTSRSANGAEVRLRRIVQTVGIPVFQFGIFSETDLSFFAGPDFNFGGRTHTNGNLFLAEGDGRTLTMGDRVTAFGEVVRTNLSNGWNTNNNYNGTVNIIRAPAVFRALAKTEGSLTGTLGSPQNEPTWTNISLSTYNGNLRNSRTGARQLNLPLVTLGAQPIDLIRRPPVNENVTSPGVYSQRYYTNNPGDQITSLRILLSDTPNDLMTLPDATGTPPIYLGNLVAGLPGAPPSFPLAGYVVGAATTTGAGIQAPFAVCDTLGQNGSRCGIGTPTLGGYIKIEMRSTAGAWVDVTLEILRLGIVGRDLSNGTNTNGANFTGSWTAFSNTACPDPNPDAIIRLQRPRPANKSVAGCGAGSINPRDYWPTALFDPREGYVRDTGNVLYPGGIMQYIELDIRNLGRWFTGAIPGSGTQAINVNGWVVYFSDRRGNRNALGQETGEYGFEDFVNPASGVGAPNGVLDTGEDVNASGGAVEVYGATPRYPAVAGSGLPPAPLNPAFSVPLDTTARPYTAMPATTTVGGGPATPSHVVARANPQIFFRRALKLVNGGLGNIAMPGLTIAAENPIYIQGDWNASTVGGVANYGNPHAATSVIGDSVSLLSNAWNDWRSFVNPGNPPGNRQATTTTYRLAIISGKGRSFPQPGGTAQDFGTDGGVHNFLRYIESWGGATLNYRGSIVSFYYNRQAVGVYKCCTTTYSPPTRGYNFDTDFLTPTLLPPRTPMFRDVNAIGFTQIVNPNQP